MKRNPATYTCFLIFLFFNSAFAQISESELRKNLEYADSIYFSNPDSSFNLLIAIEKQSRLAKYDHELAKSLVAQARYLLMRTDYEPAGAKLNEAYEIYLVKKDLSGQADVLKMRSILYERIGKKDEGNEQLSAAIELYRQDGNHHGMIRSLFNYSLNCIYLKEFSKARWALDQLEALESWMSQTDPYFLYQNSGLFEYANQNFQGSIAWFIKAKDIASQEKMHDSYATVTMLLGRSYLESKNYSEAEKWLLESYTFSKEKSLDHELSECLTVLIRFYQEKLDFKNAFLKLDEQKKVNEKLFDISRINRITELESKIGLSRKEKELAETNLSLEQEKLNNEKISSQNTRLILGSIILFLATGFILFMFLRTRKLKNKISIQALKLTHKNNLLEEAYRDITNSIQYAKRIQDAILPPRRIVQTYLKDSFILYLPKEIVAGDFYWMESINLPSHKLKDYFTDELSSKLGNYSTHEFVLFAACDCTGHGVPGAMVSVLAHNALNRAVREYGLIDPGLILNKVNELVKDTFANSTEKVNDGMDISLCCLHVNSNTLFWAGANNPLWLIRNNGIEIYEADKQAIGDFSAEISYKSHSIQLEAEDLIYIFSDGFADQFGDVSGKKYKQSKFKELLLRVSDKSMDEQRQFLKIEFDSWRGDMEQLDDICIIGVRIK